MTREEYNKLPELLKPNKFLEVTGLTVYDIRQLVEADVLTYFQPGPRKARCFHKRNLENLGIVEG